MEKDVHSFAQPDSAVVTHLNLDLKTDFNKKILSGVACWTINNISKGDKIIFDTRDLNIEKVTTGADERETTFSIGDSVQYLGKSLTVKIDASTTQVNIYYSTNADASALQWLNPQQTSGKKFPFLFTQSEAILARTWIPCQDGPGVRFSYNAKIEVPKNLLATMSASNNPEQKNDSGIYHFEQKNPIPSYLMALAVGDYGYKSISNRCGVYAEWDMLDKVAWEFADMEKMVAAAENLYGPYAWGRYDVIVLPPSFPFGGMENPCLTFATPTVVAGDRSLVALVAHELAHSWSGNLTTNANWDDFWMNEGFTVYFEQRIMESLYGKSYSEMLASLALDGMKETIADKIDSMPDDTHLKLNLKDRDPDDGMTDIAYIKGYYFLRLLEGCVGREKWDAFLKKYFADHAFQSMTTEKFVAYLNENLIEPNKEKFANIDVNEWIYGPGLPANCPQPSAERFVAVDGELKKFIDGNNPSSLNSKEWSTHEWLYFINHLPEDLSVEKMKSLDGVFHFTDSKNCEIEDAWFLLALKRNYSVAYKNMETFLINVGRRKFLTPLYKEMEKTEAGKKLAKEIYTKARPNYHFVAQQTMDEIVL